MTFQDLGLRAELLETVASLGYVAPTPIQAETIPHLLAGTDVMGQAQTGTGKTAAFTLPMLHHLESDDLQALILTPTRELAIQVSEAVYRYGSSMGVRVLPIYGGQSYSRQLRRLEKGVHVVVGTPGRTLDLINQGALNLRHVKYLVLDEADEMLKMGFIEDVETILQATNPQRQTALFSATLSEPIRRLATRYMNDPLLVSVNPETVTVDNIVQRYYMVNESEKVAALCRLLEMEDLQNTLIFARTKVGAGELAETLIARGYPAEAIHGDLAQGERERILRRFRNGQLTILVATDVVARGVDIPSVSHVINFDVPQLAAEYVHRIGRTGRAGRGGEAITLIHPRQRYVLKMIEDYTSKPITKGKLPTREAILAHRYEQFREDFAEQITPDATEEEYRLLEELIAAGYAPEQIALSAIRILRSHENQRPLEDIRTVEEYKERRDKPKSAPKTERRRGERTSHEQGMVRLFMDIGRSEGVRPADIVYGVASAANIPGRAIGAIDILQDETFFDVPEQHVEAILDSMKQSRIRGRLVTLMLAEGLFDGPRRRGNGRGGNNNNRGPRRDKPRSDKRKWREPVL
ncbi:MAG: DEAD/DEAH box helicase [Anaerolineales bacterium]|nr:DEAD/DEAH box helicase [Anaerolineales bacterium]